MARIGTDKRPAVLRTETSERAQELLDICNEHSIVAVVGIEPGLPEDISDLEHALNPPVPHRASNKIGRNDPCSCGSGRKAKKCCPEVTR